jgi:hypothetical protein
VGASLLCYAVCAGPPLVPDLTDRIARYEGEITLLENIVTRIARKRLKYPHVDDGELQVCLPGLVSGLVRVPACVCPGACCGLFVHVAWCGVVSCRVVSCRVVSCVISWRPSCVVVCLGAA